MSAITITDIGGEPRVRDVELAERLEYARPVKIRELIGRHREALQALGPLPTVGRVVNGGEATEFFLNRKQAVYLTAKSETAKAVEITIEVIERFDAYERGAVRSIPHPAECAIAATNLIALTFSALPNLGERARQAFIATTTEMVMGRPLLPAPVVEEQFWTTTEIATYAGVNASTLGKKAKAAGLKTAEHGETRLGKAKGNDRQVEQFYWNAKGREALLALLGFF